MAQHNETDTSVKSDSSGKVKTEPDCDTSAKSEKESSSSSSSDGFKEAVISVSASRWKVSRARKRPRRASHRKSHSTPAALPQSTQRKGNSGKKKVAHKRISNPAPLNQRSISYESFQRFQDGMYTRTYSMQVQPNPGNMPAIASPYTVIPAPFLAMPKYAPLHQPVSNTQPVLIKTARNAAVQSSSPQNFDQVPPQQHQVIPTQHHVHATPGMWDVNSEYEVREASTRPLHVPPEDGKYYRAIDPSYGEWNENPEYTQASIYDSEYTMSDSQETSPRKKAATSAHVNRQNQSRSSDRKSQSNAHEPKKRSHRKRKISRAIAALKDIMLEGGLPVSTCDQTSVLRTAVRYMRNLRATLDSVRCQYDTLAHQFADVNGTAVPLLKPLAGMETDLLGMTSVLAHDRPGFLRRANVRRRRQQRHRMMQRQANATVAVHDSDCSSQEDSKSGTLSALVRQKYRKEDDDYTRADSGGATYFSKLTLENGKNKDVCRRPEQEHSSGVDFENYSLQNESDHNSTRFHQECQNRGVQAAVGDKGDGDMGDIWQTFPLDSNGLYFLEEDAVMQDQLDDNLRSSDDVHDVLLGENENELKLSETLAMDISCKQVDLLTNTTSTLPLLSSFDDTQSEIKC